jgi:hypothetical protein
MKSYIPKQPKQTKERLETKLDQKLLQRLEKYCQYLESDRDYVISQVLELAFKKDKGFREWVKTCDSRRPGEPAQ